MCGPSEIVKSLEKVGFEMLEHRDVALDEDMTLTGGSCWYEYLLPSWNIFSQRFQVMIGSVVPTTTNLRKRTKNTLLLHLMSKLVCSRSPVSPSPPSLIIMCMF